MIGINKFRKYTLILAGSLFVFLGFLGIFLPILPTTPFILLASICYLKSSEKLYTWLLHNKYLGKYVRNYSIKEGIKRSTKIYILFLGSISILISSLFIDETQNKILLYSLGIIMFLVISLIKTAKE